MNLRSQKNRKSHTSCNANSPLAYRAYPHAPNERYNPELFSKLANDRNLDHQNQYPLLRLVNAAPCTYTYSGQGKIECIAFYRGNENAGYWNNQYQSA